jgi:uncharacterized protein (DUF58 family)
MTGLFAATTTTEVPRIVGDPLPAWVVVAASVALLVVIVAASLYVRGRASASADRR